MSEEATPKSRNGLLDAVAQLIERPRALLLGSTRPLFKPGCFRTFGLYSRLVAKQPQQHKVGVDLSIHHRFQVELDVSLACEAHIVAQDTQFQSIRDDAPEVTF